MRRSSLGCGAAQLVVRRLAVRQARVRISSRWRLPLLSEDAMRIQEDGPQRMVKDERSVIVLYERMLKNNKFQKEWHNATKPLRISPRIRSQNRNSSKASVRDLC
jgi:hypothetical protein